MKKIITCLISFLLAVGMTLAQETPPEWSWGDGKPILVSPVPGSTLSACMRHGFVNVVAYANHPQARKLQLRVFLNDPRTLRYDRTLEWLQPEEGGHTFELVFRGDETPGLQYLLELRSEDAEGNLIAYRYFTLFTQVLDDATPQFMYPASDETEVSRQPLIEIKPYPAHTCCPLYGVYFEIDRYPADWQGSDYQTQHFDVATYTWRVPDVLLPATTYEVRVKFLAPCERGNVNGFVSATRTFTTGTAMPHFGDPILVFPTREASRDFLCGSSRYTGVRVIPNHSDARSIRVNIWLNDPRTFVIGGGGSVQAEMVSDTLWFVLSNAVHGGEQYLIEVSTWDKNGSLLRQTYFTVLTPFIPSGYPQFISPVDHETNVSLMPVIRLRPFPVDACGKLGRIRYVLSGGGRVQTADLGPQDYTWTVPQPLQPWTDYTVTVEFWNSFYYIGYVSSSVSFTTGAGSSSRAGEEGMREHLTSAVFPNPFTDQTSLHLRSEQGPLTLQVLASDGRTVLIQTSTGGTTVPIGQQWSRGLYLVRITDQQGRKEQFRIIKY